MQWLLVSFSKGRETSRPITQMSYTVELHSKPWEDEVGQHKGAGKTPANEDMQAASGLRHGRGPHGLQTSHHGKSPFVGLFRSVTFCFSFLLQRCI